MTLRVFDERSCTLGEGPLWHPQRKQLFWFDIIEKKLLSVDSDQQQSWAFDDYVSAAGWVDFDTLLIASSTALWRLDLGTGAQQMVHELERSNDTTRSNDGRADPWGGFWIGTMGCNAEPEAGSIYRFYQGRLRRLFDRITIPNAICFAPDKSAAYFADTAKQHVMRIPLGGDGWPSGKASVFVDFTKDDRNPDGAVTDVHGNLWIALWGASCVAQYDSAGSFVSSVEIPAQHVTCPAFGGDDMGTLFVTSARQGLSQDTLSRSEDNGKTFVLSSMGEGLSEPQVRL